MLFYFTWAKAVITFSVGDVPVREPDNFLTGTGSNRLSLFALREDY